MTASKRAAAVLLTGALVSTATFAGTNAWTNSGPPGGSPRELRASLTQENVSYGSFNSSMYRSTDGGITWHALREFDSLVSGFAIDPNDSNRIYVAVYDDGIYSSNDGGETFNLLVPVSTGAWAVGVSGATVYYATNARTFHRSTDHGQTWTEVMATSGVLFRFLIDANDANTVYGYAQTSNTLFKSTDGGNSWTTTAIGAGGFAVYNLVQLSTTQLIAATTAGLFTSNDAGASWTQTRVGSAGQFYGALAAVRSIPGRAFASFEGGLLLTTDFGATWSTSGTATIGRITNIALDAQAPTRMVISGGGGAAYSRNGGQTWTRAVEPPVTSSPSELVTTSAENSKVYTYVDSSGLFSTSGDAGWQFLNLDAAAATAGPFNKPRLAVKPGAPNTVYITPQGNWPVRSDDGGNTWTSPTTSSMNMDPAAFAFDKDNSNIIYAAMKRRAAFPAAAIYRSLDGGVNWAPYSNDFFAFESRDLQIDPVDGSRMFAAGSADYVSAGIWRSVDRGVTWGRVAQTALGGVDIRNIAINPATPARIYASTQLGLYASSDGGDSFAANTAFGVTTGNRAATSVQIDPTVPTTVYAISQSEATASGRGLASSSHVLRSVDEGQTWEVLRDATASPRWAVTDLALDPNEPSLVYVTTGGYGIGTLRIAPDLAVEISGHSGTRPQNEPATFNVRAVNNGPYAATVVRLVANIPAGLTNVSTTTDRGNCTTAAAVITCDTAVLRVGEEMNVVVHYTPAAVMGIPVTASIAAHESDVTPGNNSAEASARTEGDFASLRVTIQPSVLSVTRGGSVTFVTTVTNNASVTASGTLTVTPGSGITLGTLPSGCSNSGGAVSCSLASMEMNASRIFSFPATVNQVGAVSVTATATVAAPVFEFDPADNTATATTTGTEPPPSSGGGGGGGGGAFNLTSVLALLLLSLVPRRRRNAAVEAD